jgi:hypothetical protein
VHLRLSVPLRAGSGHAKNQRCVCKVSVFCLVFTDKVPNEMQIVSKFTQHIPVKLAFSFVTNFVVFVD